MIIYTDGAYSSATNRGGWAFIIPIINNEPIIEFGSVENTTNNRMELTAIIEAIKYIKTIKTDNIIIYTDSAYIVNCFEENWYKKWQTNGWINSSNKPVKNKDLWEELLLLIDSHPNIKIAKVKGHENNIYNNLADKYAVLARQGEK